MGTENQQNQSVYQGNPQYEEFVSYPEFSPLTDESSSGKKRGIGLLSEEEQKTGAEEPKKKSNKLQTFLQRILLPTTVAVAAIVTAETVGIVGFSDVTVREAYVETSESGVWYSMELDGYEEGKDELAVEVYNDFERFREPLHVEEDYHDQEAGKNPEERHGRFAYGEIFNLRSDTDYTLEVLYGSWTIYKQQIRTAKQEEPWQDEPHEDPDTGDPTQAWMEFQPSDSMIFYSISIEDFQQTDRFVVRLLRDGKLMAENEAKDIFAEEPYIAGEFYNLEPDTEYTLQLVKNPESDAERIVTAQTVWTRSVEEIIPEPSFSSTEDSIFYSIPVSEFGADDWFMLLLLENGDGIQEGDTSDLSAENPYLTGEFHDLQPGTEYTVQLMKNQQVIFEQQITTQGEKVQPREPEFGTTENEIFYSIPLPEFGADDRFTVFLLENDDEIRGEEFTDLSPDQEYVGGAFTDLEPGTEYMIQLLKNREIIFEQQITTAGEKIQPAQNDNEYFSIVEGMIYYNIPIDESEIEQDIPVNFALYMFADETEEEEICESYPIFNQNEDGTAFVEGYFEDFTISEPGIYIVRLRKNLYNDWETIAVYHYEISETDLEMLGWKY